ncbi:MAG: peptide synthetase [Pedosphaera sp.]|nr:peptide synthetase [Pedosphaera sp.]
MSATLRSFLAGESRPDFLRDELLHELFAASARRRPEHPALRCRNEVLSYGELLRRSSQLARYLRGFGVGRGERVAIWMPRGLDMHVAVLGVLQAGAAYVPLDPDCPLERAAYVVSDCGARCLITARELAPAPGALPCQVVVFEDEEAEMAACAREVLTCAETSLTPDDCAYIIYTSGSTGRPKGVMISHRSICHLVRSEGSVLGLRENDVVFQGFSLSFDMSLEEIWPTWTAGATLLVGTTEMMRAGSDLAALLAREEVTVWSCVPTLLAMQETTVPTLRLLNLGGEACPPELVRLHTRPGLRILNTYGPTETTITATVAEIAADQPVTIGRPLPNYTCHFLSEKLAAVKPGESGELCIGGPGLALGYVGRADLTAEKFIPNPLFVPGGCDPVLYRTGDLARLNAAGQIEFLGRMDTQVKIRGFRVELSEIEAVMAGMEGVRNAAVVLHKDEQGVDILVAYVLPGKESAVDETFLRACLKERLPSYMVPALFEVVATLPTLPSGKVDRKSLPKPTRSAPAEERVIVAPTTPTETALHTVWREIFAPLPVSVEDDFFLGLGGHSLRAARMVSLARKQTALAHVSMVDVYNEPTIRRLAIRLDATRPRATDSTARAKQREEFLPVPSWRYFACAAAQAVSLVFIFAVFSLQWLIPYLSYAILSNQEMNKFVAVALSLAFFVAAIPVMLGIGIVVKWLVIGRLKPGEHPLWGAYYFRWWLVRRVLDTVPTEFLGGTPLMAFYYRLLGARIGQNVFLRDDTIDAPDCVEIGDDASFSPGATLSCWKVENGRLKIGRVCVGRGCYLGANSAVAPGARLEDGAEVEDLSMVPPGVTVPAGEVWGGSPARFVRHATASSVARPSSAVRVGYAAMFGVLLFIFPVFTILPIFPGMMLMAELDQASDAYHFLLLSPVLAAIFVVSMCLQIALLKWLLVGRVRPARHAVFSLAYVRHWLADKLMELSLDTVNPLYATIYLNPWYRLLGVKLGARAEVSTASSIGFDTLNIGEESFVADGVVLGAPRVQHGEFVLEETVIARRAFIGNAAVVPAGAAIGDGVLIGVLSVPPARREDALKTDSSWFGTPAVFLPQRQAAQQFDEGSTFRPHRHLFVQRAIIEFVRVILPLTCLIALTSLLMSFVVDLNDDDQYGWSLWQVAAVFPLLYLAYGAAAGLFGVVLKWLVIGRYRPVEKPLWNNFVWRSELVTSTYENLAVPFFAGLLSGTPFLPAYLRLLGCKIGRRVFMETTDITEFDVVSIGDDAALNSDCGPQTHLFEDRVMKISRVDIGARCVLGGGSIILYDTKMEAGSSLGELSLLMKGETLPAGTSWEGSPARPVA